MGRPCTVCTRADRAEIEERLGAGTSLRTLAADTGLTRAALHRHRHNCKREPIVAVPAVIELLEPETAHSGSMSSPTLTPIGSRPVNPLVADALSMRRTTDEKQALLSHFAHETAVQAMNGALPNLTNSRVKALKFYASTITIDAALAEARAKVAAEPKGVPAPLALLLEVLSPNSTKDFTAFDDLD